MKTSLLLAILAASVAVSCGPPPPPPPPAKIATTYRILGGVSMGGIGAAALAFSRPERFDGVTALGGPIDAAFFQHMLDDSLMAGFCPLSELQAIAAQDPTRLNDPAVVNACAKVGTPTKWEHPNDFNHWHVTNNGGTFDRDSYIKMMSDLALAFGNFFYENPASPYAPPGVSPALARKPPADFCTNPVRVKNVFNAEFNPTGTYDAITFCDGEQTLYTCTATGETVNFCSDPANVVTPLPASQWAAFASTFCLTRGGVTVVTKNDSPLVWLARAGDVDACRERTRPVPGLLAVDINGNGRRDYGEPVINNGRERYDDVGVDGCADALEDGRGGCTTTANPAAVDPNQDDYDVDARPLGTEGNWRWDQGEPFRDLGLDGVAGTSDFGEGNGVFDVSSGRRRLVAHDGRTAFKSLDEAQRKRFNVLVDGGIRDIFNLGLMAKHLFGGVKALRETPTGSYRDFLEIPGMVDRRSGNFLPWNNRWPSVPRDLLLLFGHETPTDEDLQVGEGDHVGTPSQAVNRFAVAFNWAASTWPNLERPATPLGGSTASERQKVEWFQSTALGAKWEYGVALPPGYDEPVNADKRYPVMFLMHGYGMDPTGFMGTALITDTYTTDTDVKFRPMIFVFPNGRCCYVNDATGGRDCRSADDTGRDFDRIAGWERECNSGTFYVNRSGYTAGDGTRYGDAFFELMDHIDAKYRTVPAAEVEAR